MTHIKFTPRLKSTSFTKSNIFGVIYSDSTNIYIDKIDIYE